MITGSPRRRPIRVPWLQVVASFVVLAAFFVVVAVRLGPALVGAKTFSGVDVLTGLAPWDDRWLRETWQSPWVGDTVDSMLPSYLELRTRLLTGDLPLWSNLAGSGTPLLASTNIASLTPSTIWMLLAPTWWAIGFAKLIQLAMGLGGMTLWLRRLGTSWAAGALAGVLYCTSGFIVAWSGWLAQSGVAATIPLLFWAIERFIALRTVKAALLLSLIVAWLLLGGFPAVAGHALYAGAAYFLVRCTVEHRLLGWRRVATTIAGGTAAVLLGIGLSAVQVVPLLMSLAGTDTDYRNDQFDREQPVRSLLSVALPRIFNFGGGPANGYGPDTNPIEAYAFLGLGAVALALLAVLAGRFHGVARGAVPTLAMVGALAAALVWKHGFWTDWLSDVPVFAGNDAGRLRDLVALTGCALAGIGFNLLFLQDLPQRVRRRLVTGAWVIVGTATTALLLVWRTYENVVDGRILAGDAGLAVVGALLVAIAFTLALGRAAGPAGEPPADRPAAPAVRPGRRSRALLAVTLAGFAAVTGAQALSSTEYFWPLSDTDDFYPRTPGVDAAAAATGSSRALAGDGTFFGSSATAHGIRTLTGHSFLAPTWADVLLALDPDAVTPPGRTPTNPRVRSPLVDPTAPNPLLDRLAVSALILRPENRIPGPTVDRAGRPRDPAATSSKVTSSNASITVGSEPVSAGTLTAQDLRGVMVRVVAPAGDGQHGIAITATVRDAAGTQVATGTSIRSEWKTGWAQIPVAGGDLRDRTGPLTVSVAAYARDIPGQTLELGAAAGQVDLLVIAGQPDGLRLSFADGSVTVMQRLTAQPRVRWARTGTVIEDPDRRLTALADPDTPRDTVILSSPGPEASGLPATVAVRAESGDRVTVEVQADGAGYLVLADAVQSGWAVRVNGEPATIVDADHALGAVFLPPGSSTVEFRYVGTGLAVGAAITAVSLAILLLALVGPNLRRRFSTRSTTVEVPAADKG